MSEKCSIDDRFQFLQQVHHYTNYGYTEFFIGFYPGKKMDRAKEIDKKIIERYKANLDKDRKYYRKKKGLSNFVFLRSKDMYIILKTSGEVDFELQDAFVSLKKETIKIAISENIVMEIFRDGRNKFTVKIEKNCFRDIREQIRDLLDKRRFNEAATKFSNLNGLPSFSAVIKQKIDLKKYILNHVKKNNLAKKEVYAKFEESLRINTKRKVYKIDWN